MGELLGLSTVDNIINSIYIIRGQQVMLDSDLAKIYGYEVKRLNEQVKRNIKRFPEDFMFQLVESEIPDSLKSQFATLNINENKRGMHIKKMPYVFTEQGIYMLATVLKGELAEQQSIFIMRAFKEMRHYIRQNRQFVTQSEMNLVTAKVSELSVQMADVAYIDIYQQATKSIYVVDDYMNTKTLQLLSQKQSGVEVILFTENGHGKKGFLTSAVVKDFINQYPTLRIKPNPDCHDRWIILDYGLPAESVYHCGASSKDAGKKLCAINKVDSVQMIHPVIDRLLLLPDKQI